MPRLLSRAYLAAATWLPSASGGGGGGGAVNLTATGLGVTASAISAVAAATALWAKGRVRVDAIKALGNGFVWQLLYVDNNGTGGKFQAYITCTATGGPYTLTCNAVGLGGVTTSTVAQASLPANGQDVVWGVGYAQGSQAAYLFDGLGNTLASATGAQFDGNMGTAGGFVTVNGGTGATGGPTACLMDGVALYAATPPAAGAIWSSKPASGDANIVYLSYMNDATSGTTPATSAAQVGTTGLTWTAGQFSYTTDSTSGHWG